MGNAITYRMPSGIPGDISRLGSSDVEAGVLNSALPFSAYGVAVKKASGKFIPFAGGETIADLVGLLVRPYPQGGADAAGVTPPVSGIGNVMRRGFITVLNRAGTPADGGTVYIRVAAAAGAKIIGGIEAVADAANTIVLTGAKFKNAGDAAGNVEIEYNI